MSPDDQAKKGFGDFLLSFFKNYDHFSEENASFHLLSKFNCVSKINQTSNQNFPTPIFRQRCREDIAMLIASSRSNTLEMDLISEPRYFGK